MKTTPATPVKSASFDGTEEWHSLDWANIQVSVRKTQLKIAQATGEGNWRRVKRLQRLLTHSFHGRCLAVRRVTENRGRKTPGVDGATWATPSAKLRAVMSLSKKRGYRAQPLRRVWIPKPGKAERRPLGIPTMLDRAMQALYLLALEPVVESTSDPRSYGFRPDRATTDAMVELFHLLATPVAPTWVMEGDIKGFFDNINHDWLIKNVPMDKMMLRKWLRAGVVDRRQFAATEAGTPQGGIISPCLANVTLNGLETQLKRHLAQKLGVKKAEKTKVQVVRYADDFVITADSKELLEDEVRPWVEQFLAVRGVELSREKTHITHILDGFDFLGWNFRKYVPKSPKRKTKLLIKPSRKNASAFYRKVSEIVRDSGALTQDALIGQLNPVLKGWAQYHSQVVAKRTFSKLDHMIHWRIWRWAKRRHPNKSAKWIKKKYFHYIGGRKWVFAHPYKSGNGKTGYRQLFLLASTEIRRGKRLPLAYQPYDAEQELKWEDLRVKRMQHKLQYRGQILRLFQRQRGVCALCGHAVSKETGWHDHHVIRRVDGGSDKPNNRVLLHPNCHSLIHSRRQEVTLLYSGL
ncbi:group II intron reverse transcriptase/maturase [Pseudomonas sp. JS3066]|uniref:group II intron reverse transcriptase/maturase n=1 Tax=Pseudomonas sp. JS3066 TaxID=3090665 RepID=UPI002E7B10E9|nr:group II intron reverse transcriptase/maturase [Pseudomonas sp. JS3066]WVK93358.1 group II intron reverse transcriptase/maturase [Pseudomonas sp. JS3066]